MPKSGKVKITASEIIASLSRSALPTIVVEGGDDMIVFRKLESELERFNVDVLAAEGRTTLLEVFSRRAEIDSGQTLAFVADKDWWVSAAVPPEYVSSALVFTDGYSIENDVYRDGNFFGYMTAPERVQFHQDVNTIIDCYALGLSRIISNRSGRIAVHPNEILNDPLRRLQLMSLESGEQYPTQLRDLIAADFGKMLRGKTLMAVLMRQLCSAGRAAKHNSQALMEVVGNNRGPLLNRLFHDVEQIFV